MGVSYSEFPSPLLRGAEEGIWKPGDRCPDVTLTTASGEDTRLYATVPYGDFLVLSIGRTMDNMPSGIPSTSALTILPLASPNGHTNGATNGRGGHANGHVENKTFTADWVTEGDASVVVVRPDMYVGYAGKGNDEGWRVYLEDILAKTT
jgi:phenol 2-monooxygenase (NADPH)